MHRSKRPIFNCIPVSGESQRTPESGESSDSTKRSNVSCTAGKYSPALIVRTTCALCACVCVCVCVCRHRRKEREREREKEGEREREWESLSLLSTILCTCNTTSTSVLCALLVPLYNVLY